MCDGLRKLKSQGIIGGSEKEHLPGTAPPWTPDSSGNGLLDDPGKLKVMLPARGAQHACLLGRERRGWIMLQDARDLRFDDLVAVEAQTIDTPAEGTATGR